jgi:hypothetical protein
VEEKGRPPLIRMFSDGILMFVSLLERPEETEALGELPSAAASIAADSMAENILILSLNIFDVR